jgi:hypothetical protein
VVGDQVLQCWCALFKDLRTQLRCAVSAQTTTYAVGNEVNTEFPVRKYSVLVVFSFSAWVCDGGE